MPQSLKNLVENVRFNCPGAEDGAIIFALRNIARDFLKQTEAWTEDIIVDAIANQSKYTLKYSSNSIVYRIIVLNINDCYVPEAYYMFDDNTLELSDTYTPTQNIHDGISAECVILPKLNQNEISQDVLDHYGDYIVAGATMLLSGSPKKPYTDPQIYALNKSKYNEGLTRAINERARRHKLSVPVWRA